MLNRALEPCVLVQVQVFLGLIVILTQEALMLLLAKEDDIGQPLTS